MKKIWIAVLVLAVAATLMMVACGGTGEETTTSEAAATTTTAMRVPIESGTIALCLPALDNPLMIAMEDAFTTAFSDDFTVEVSSADGSATTQAQQVENYTSMGVEFMCVMAVEATSLLPYLEDAREAGVIVMTIGSEPGETGRDAVMKMDQFLAGEYCALMAKNWVDETYPDAADGSVETAVLTSSLTTEAVERTSGLMMISEPFLKDWEGAYIDAEGNAISDKDGNYLDGKSDVDRVDNPVYCAAVNIAVTQEAEMFQAGQTAMDNILTTNPDVKVVLAYASDGGSGASQAIMDEVAKGSGSVIEDATKVGVFGVGMFGPEGDTLIASAEGNGALRGVIAFGSGDLPGETMALITKILAAEDYPAVTWDALALVVVEDGELVITPMNNSGVVTATPLAP